MTESVVVQATDNGIRTEVARTSAEVAGMPPIQTEAPTVMLFSIWNINGGPLSEDAQKKLERSIERTIKTVEKAEGLRLLYNVTTA